MSARLSLFALALSLTACSPGGPASNAPPSDKALATPSPSGAAGAANPERAPSASDAPPARADASRAPAAAAAPPEPATSAAAREAAPPSFREVTIPAGTALAVRLTTPLASDTNTVEDAVRGTLTSPIVVAGTTAVPAGAEVIGTVRDAKQSGRVKGLASISFRFDRLVVRGEALDVRTALVSREARVKRSEDVKKGAIGAGAGAIVGGIIGGGKGAAIGAGVGGTGAVMATRGEEVRLPSGTTVRTTLQQPLKVLVPGGSGS
jgi:hypothetical protein